MLLLCNSLTYSPSLLGFCALSLTRGQFTLQVTPTSFNCAPPWPFKNKIGDTLKINFRRTRKDTRKDTKKLCTRALSGTQSQCSLTRFVANLLDPASLRCILYPRLRPNGGHISSSPIVHQVSSLFLTHGAGCVY